MIKKYKRRDEIGKKGGSCEVKEKERSRRRNEKMENTMRGDITDVGDWEGCSGKNGGGVCVKIAMKLERKETAVE